ncbi:hypothetical protein H9P43_003656 [Blastocladiella emersonii ATCC 22665]|nr:hypothetical protein H9P43_003656 [Blastocladiella emersonii ATCC 22665]
MCPVASSDHGIALASTSATGSASDLKSATLDRTLQSPVPLLDLPDRALKLICRFLITSPDFISHANSAQVLPLSGIGHVCRRLHALAHAVALDTRTRVLTGVPMSGSAPGSLRIRLRDAPERHFRERNVVLEVPLDQDSPANPAHPPQHTYSRVEGIEAQFRDLARVRVRVRGLEIAAQTGVQLWATLGTAIGRAAARIATAGRTDGVPVAFAVDVEYRVVQDAAGLATLVKGIVDGAAPLVPTSLRIVREDSDAPPPRETCPPLPAAMWTWPALAALKSVFLVTPGFMTAGELLGLLRLPHLASLHLVTSPVDADAAGSRSSSAAKQDLARDAAGVEPRVLRHFLFAAHSPLSTSWLRVLGRAQPESLVLAPPVAGGTPASTILGALDAARLRHVAIVSPVQVRTAAEAFAGIPRGVTKLYVCAQDTAPMTSSTTGPPVPTSVAAACKATDLEVAGHTWIAMTRGGVLAHLARVKRIKVCAYTAPAEKIREMLEAALHSGNGTTWTSWMLVYAAGCESGDPGVRAWIDKVRNSKPRWSVREDVKRGRLVVTRPRE